MDFHSDKPIYLQIADVLCEQILSGKLADQIVEESKALAQVEKE